MGIELDHLFVCTAPGAPEAEKLVQVGLREGVPNQHPGQGTANRRFDFVNAMIELIWVSDAKEAQSPRARRTLLWKRWSGRAVHASPFGICLRPTNSEDAQPPFPAWEYRPPYLPHPLCLHVADSGVEEPMWVYLSFMRRVYREQRFIEHSIGIREITGLTLTTPVPLRSAVSQRIVEGGILSTRTEATSLLEVAFDNNRREKSVDFRPHLPLIFQL
jgi:hypothetical protein